MCYDALLDQNVIPFCGVARVFVRLSSALHSNTVDCENKLMTQEAVMNLEVFQILDYGGMVWERPSSAVRFIRYVR